jgi:pyruvate formate lyase activating enzyme
MSDFDLRGFIETSFLDWDGKISSVIFVPGCNLRCPFCQNSLLIQEAETLKKIPIEKIEEFLSQRKDFIDGVVITGGEPTLHPWLAELAKRFKDQGFLVKIDTNGTRPQALAELISRALVDCLAMDYKAPLDERYHRACGVKVDLEKIRESIRLIMESKVDYEFRITVVPALHSKEDLIEMAKAIAGAKKVALQSFVNKETLDKSFEQIKPYSAEELKILAEAVKVYVPNTIVRGV